MLDVCDIARWLPRANRMDALMQTKRSTGLLENLPKDRPFLQPLLGFSVILKSSQHVILTIPKIGVYEVMLVSMEEDGVDRRVLVKRRRRAENAWGAAS